MLYKSQNDPKAGHLLMAGNQEKLIEIDLETQQHLRTVDIFEDAESGIKGCYYMKGNPRFICMSDCEGKVILTHICSFYDLKLFQFGPTDCIA